MADPIRRRGRPPKARTSQTPAAGTGATPPASVQALDRALDLLDLLAARPGLTLSEVAETAGQPASSVHRLLHTLAARGMVQSDPATQAWAIGPQAFRLGAAFTRRSGLVDCARPILRALTDHTGETAILGTIEGHCVLHLAQVETSETIRASLPPGTRSALHASGIGKALLAFGRPEMLDRLLDAAPLARFTDRTLTDPQELRADLARIRHRGFSLDDEERSRGMRCIAAPVLDPLGEAVAALSVSGPAHRIGPAHVKTLGAVVAAAAASLTEAMGGRPN